MRTIRQTREKTSTWPRVIGIFSQACIVCMLGLILPRPAHSQSTSNIFACPYYNANARATLTAAITSSQTTVVTSLMNSLWPQISQQGLGEIFVDAEQMLVNTRVDTTVTTLTVTRGVNGTIAVAHANNALVRPVCSTIFGATASLPVNQVGQEGHLLVVEFLTAVADVTPIQVRLEASATCPDPPPTGTCAGGNWFPISADITKAVYTTATTPPMAYAIVQASGVFQNVRVNNLVATPANIPMNVYYSGAPFPFGNVTLNCPTPLSCIFIINPGGGGGEHVITFIINSTGGSIPTALTGSGTIDFPSINDGACADGTFTVTGAVAGDVIAPGWPSVVPAATGMYGTMSVSAADTVQARMCNLSGAPVDLASATFKATDIVGGGGGGGTIALGTTGLYPSIEDFSCAITSCTISANTACSVTTDVWKRNAAIPSGADKISGATGGPILAAAQLNQNACDLAQFSTTSVIPGDVFGLNIATVAGCSTVMVQLWCQ